MKINKNVNASKKKSEIGIAFHAGKKNCGVMAEELILVLYD